MSFPRENLSKKQNLRLADEMQSRQDEEERGLKDKAHPKNIIIKLL